VRVLPKEGRHLVGGDAQRQGLGGGLARDGAHKQVGQQGIATHKHAQHCHLDGGGGVGIHPALEGRVDRAGQSVGSDLLQAEKLGVRNAATNDNTVFTSASADITLGQNCHVCLT
jgi:hypothetical protein